MGPTLTPTRTLGMRLSCNFVNMYTIVYHVQYMYTCTRAHLQWTSLRGKACVGQKSTDKSASWTARACRGRLTATVQCTPTSARAGHADFHRRILARKSARKSVSVSVSMSVPWNLSFTKQQQVMCCIDHQIVNMLTATTKGYFKKTLQPNAELIQWNQGLVYDIHTFKMMWH